MTPAAQDAITGTEGRIDQYMGALLRAGVILAAIIVLIGGVIYLTRHAGPAPNYREFHGEPAELRSISGIFHGALSLRGRGLIQLGLLLLIATPIARVAFSFFAFLCQRDWVYVVITFVVLGLLSYSLLGGRG